MLDHGEQPHPTKQETDSHQSYGLFTDSGQQLLDSPTPQMRAAIEQHNAGGRIEYFRFGLPHYDQRRTVDDEGNLQTEQYIAGWTVSEDPRVTYQGNEGNFEFYKSFNKLGVGGNIFASEAVVPLLEQRISQEFAGKQIALRGTATSLDFDHLIEIDGKKILNTEEIVSAGVENGANYAAQTHFDSNARDEKIGFRSAQWLIDHARDLRMKAIKEGRESDASKIFPLLLVYDRSKFPPNTTELPKTGRDEVILKAYVLDYPIPDKK